MPDELQRLQLESVKLEQKKTDLATQLKELHAKVPPLLSASLYVFILLYVSVCFFVCLCMFFCMLLFVFMSLCMPLYVSRCLCMSLCMPLYVFTPPICLHVFLHVFLRTSPSVSVMSYVYFSKNHYYNSLYSVQYFK